MQLQAISIVLAVFTAFGMTLTAQGTPSSAPGGNVADDAKPAISKPFVVLELYTSEGCSSCPPAEKHVDDWAQEAAKSGARIFPIAFHVDYWDRLGWPDPFASKKCTQRQYAYAAMFKKQGHKIRGLFTPQMIANGKASTSGNNRKGVKAAVDKLITVTPVAGLKVTATQGTAAESVAISFQTIKAPKGALLTLTVVESNLVTKVTKGENKGKTLHHTNVVRALEVRKLDEGTAGKTTLTSFNLSRKLNFDHVQVVAWIQDPASGTIIAAEKASLTDAARPDSVDPVKTPDISKKP